MVDNPKNPFTPMVGKVPPYMAGRDAIIDDMRDALQSGGNAPSTISLYMGARGTGKTALLSYFAELAQQDGWITAKVSAEPGMLDEVIIRIGRAARHLEIREPERKIAGASIAKLVSVQWEKSKEPLSSWRSKMDDLLDALAESETGLLITVDEVDAKLDEMTVLVSAFQHFIDEGRRVVLAMAGLPYGLSALLSGKSTSFLRRAARYEVGAIGDADVEEALMLTMEQGGKTFERDAMDLAVEAIGGFPFMFQLVGYRAWRIAEKRDVVMFADVEAAVRVAKRGLREQVHDATWFELSAAEREFLRAMLQDGGATRQADLPQRLGKASGHVSNYKRRLLEHGVIRERGRGVLEFCLPGFREYIEEMDEAGLLP